MTFELLLAALAGAGLTYLAMRARAPHGPRLRLPPLAPGDLSESPVRDPFLSRLYATQHRMNTAPRVSTPDDLLELRPFMDLVELLTPPEIQSSFLLRYFEGDDLVLACASLVALSKRPADPDAAKRVLARLNRFHAWTRHFQLRVLEAWRPEDPKLAGDVLVRVDESWQTPEAAQVLEGFLRRRAAVAPLALDAVDRPEGFDTERLREILESLDPDLVRPIADELGPAPRQIASGMAGWPGEVAGLTLENLGRVCWPGKAKAAEAIPYASADERLERVLTALASPPDHFTARSRKLKLAHCVLPGKEYVTR